MTETPQPAGPTGEPPNGPPSQPPHSPPAPSGDPQSEINSCGTGLPTGHHPPIPPGNPQSEIPNPQSVGADDLFAPEDPFEPGQYAMHGLLAAFFRDSALDREQRVRAVMKRIRSEASKRPSPAGISLPIGRRAAFLRRLSRSAGARFLSRTHPRHWLLAGMAAAGLVGVLSFFWQSTPQARADIYADAANAGTAMFYFARDLSGLFSSDPALAEQYRQTIEDEKRKRDEALAAVAGAPELYDTLPGDILVAWQALYCTYRELGLRDEAIRENEAALAYIRKNRLTEEEGILLDGLGNTLAAFGDYLAARKAYLDSIAVRRAGAGETRDPHAGEAGYEGHLSWHLVFPYLRLVILSIAEGDLAQAGHWQSLATKALCDRFRRVCERCGVNLPASASLWEVWNALPAEYRHPKVPYSDEDVKNWPEAWRLYGPSDGQVIMVGAVLYHEAILQRLSGDYAAAHQTLDRAETLFDYLTRWPGNDEYHLPLLFRLEQARLAIIKKDYSDALRHLDRAEQYDAAIRDYFAKQAAGQIDAPTVPDVHKLPLSPLRRAEMNLLRGVALLGLEEAATVGPPWPMWDGEAPAKPVSSALSTQHSALSLIHSSLALPEKLAAALPADQREKFLNQFAPWAKLAEQHNEGTAKE